MDKFKILKAFLIKLDQTFRIQIENSHLPPGSSFRETMTPKTFSKIKGKLFKEKNGLWVSACNGVASSEVLTHCYEQTRESSQTELKQDERECLL